MLTNPFKSVVPLIGDYDISVVIEALKLRECRVSLHVVFNPRVSSARLLERVNFWQPQYPALHSRDLT